MTRLLTPKHRPGRTIQPGQDIRPVGDNWTPVVARQDSHDPVNGMQIKLTLDGGREFWVQPSATYETRRLAKGN